MEQKADSAADVESWEELEHLSLEELRPKTEKSLEERTQEAPPACTATGDEQQGLTAQENGQTTSGDVQASADIDGNLIDKALQEALSNPRERATLLRLDAEVERFVKDGARTVLEFASELTSYQRLLAHRVAQHYGLQTTSVPWGKGSSRVVARRTPESRVPEVKVTDLKDTILPPEMLNAKATPEVTIKRRQGAPVGRVAPFSVQSGLGNAAGTGVRSVKQREEEYKAARERILGKPGEVGSPVAAMVSADVAKSGRFTPMDDLKRRKAVFRDKMKEMQDPDYRRGTNRYQRTMFDPNYNPGYDQGRTGLYNVPTFNTEFPPLAAQAPSTAAQTAPPQPYPPQPMGMWAHHRPSPNHTQPQRPQGSFQPASSSSAPHGPPPNYSMMPHPYQMHPMGYSYPPGDMQTGGHPSQPPSAYPPSTTNPMVYRQMPVWNRSPGYMMPPNQHQESMGMVHPPPYPPMYGAYPPQGPGYRMGYGEMGQYPAPMPVPNGYDGQFAPRGPRVGNFGGAHGKQGEQGLQKHEASTKPQPVEN